MFNLQVLITINESMNVQAINVQVVIAAIAFAILCYLVMNDFNKSK